ncbi:MAG: hypothetical protein Q9166_003623 [cf. Caloplaca sp. 2 TL-2023]
MAGLPSKSEIKDSTVPVVGTTADVNNATEDGQCDENEVAMEDLSFIIFGDMGETSTEGGMDIAIIHWSKNCEKADCNDSRMQIEATEHLKSSDGPSLLFGQLKQASTVSRTKIMRLMTLQIESGYHSSIDKTGGSLNFSMSISATMMDWVDGKLGAYYNLQGDREPDIDGNTVVLKFNWQSLSFSYDLNTGRATYLLACADKDFEYYKKALGDQRLPAGRRSHPFSIHLILLFKGVLARNEELEGALRKLLLFEDRSIFRRSKVTFESGDDTKRRLQELHSLLKEVLIRDNDNKRYIATTESLIRDLDRLQQAVKTIPGAFPIDEYDHQRMVDGFHCLKSFCLDRERRLETRLQRVQNLIALTYNLLANRDSITSHSIAHEARQDGAAMKTIALVTMLFFPATFVAFDDDNAAGLAIFREKESSERKSEIPESGR